MKKPNYDNSIENNKREAFKANVKQQFKENLKTAPKYATIYFVTNIIGQYFFKSEIDVSSALIEAAMFSIFALLGIFSTNHKKK